MISLISAIGKNREIGRGNDLLWDLPADMKHFRDTTRGHTVVMGQKTFESLGTGEDGTLGRPLPNRRNIVMTRDANFTREGIEIVHSKEELLTLLEKTENKDSEIFIIGGGQIYTIMMDSADKLYITHVEQAFPDADTFFPEIDENTWQKTKSEHIKKDEKNMYDMEFAEYLRKK